MLHIWLIPVLIIVAVVFLGFYGFIRSKGGTGVRADGRTVMDKPGPEDEDLP
ncbi:MAG TPA: hypothetical protein VHH88_02950 [Verrucomicrobiae bacterium]|nr:hypothetical protein [Verrucomicrobiae bacterium]